MRYIFALLVIACFLPISVSHAQTATPTSSAFTTTTPTPNAAGDSDRYRDLEKQINELQQKLSETQNRGKTLSSEIAYMDNQIKRTTLEMGLTEQKVADLESEIESLTGKMEKLEVSLTKLSEVLLNRIVETYKNRSLQSVEYLFSSHDLGDFMLKFKYVRAAQANDKMLMFDMQQTKDVFAQQKTAREDKKREQIALQEKLKEQKVQLDSQKVVKANLLSTTKNDEKKYQELLAQSQAEFEAIQAITAGKGDETEVGKVSEGSKIASIIQGPSCNSSGAHLHFIVGQGGNTLNPFSQLKSGMSIENCSGSSCGSSDGDSANASGSWNWPIEGPIRMSQGYGSTWATRNTWVGRVYNFHNGIDINGPSSEVKAVKAGTLYRGSYGGSNGCRLRYVRVDHEDSDLETFYLHINY